jgi:hypothetical protein
VGEEPKVVNIVEAQGEVSDEIDYLVNMKLLEMRGGGFTACQPSLVELENGVRAIRMGIDHTFIDSETGQVMGYGIIGYVYVAIDSPNYDILYITPQEELDEKVKYILENDVEPQPRPRGKY